jgi:PAS domain S-box
LQDLNRYITDPGVKPAEICIEINELTRDTLFNRLIENGEDIKITDKGKTIGRINNAKFLSDYMAENQKNLEFYKNIFEKIKIGICIIDAEGRVIEWNKCIEEIYGISREKILGKNIKEFFKEPVNFNALKSRSEFLHMNNDELEGRNAIVDAYPIYLGDKFLGVISTDYSKKQINELYESLQKANKKITELQNKILKFDTDNTTDLFIGQSRLMRKQLDIADKIAQTDVPILISGESGVGKEVFARYIHTKSGREGAFVAINCSAIPDNLFESMFFGYKRGAFTGANERGQKGYFELAHKGTLFLDEIGEMPLAQQAKLLRVLQENKYLPLGAEKENFADVRFITATNVELNAAIEEKRFREDLYYRIKGIKIYIPSVRARSEDIPELLNYFLRINNRKYNKKIAAFSDAAMHILQQYSWPGNIREIKSNVQQMVIMAADKIIKEEDISDDIRYVVSNNMLNKDKGLIAMLDRYEQYLIREALVNADGDIKFAAKSLGVPRSTLYYKLEKFRIKY